MLESKFTKTIIPIEIELGFVRIPNKFKKLFPSQNSRISVYFSKQGKTHSLSYDPKNQRIYGLVSFYRSKNAEPKDVLEIEKLREKTFKFSFYKLGRREKEKKELTQEEAEEVLDLSNLSATAKGNIVEDRIKELILLYGQGLLSVYKPTSDTEGIDLVVKKKDVYQPIFIQVKSNFKLQGGRSLLVQVRTNTLNPHHTFYIVAAYFNPKTLEIHDKLLFMPSEIFIKKSSFVNKDKYKRLSVSLFEGSTARGTEYLVGKTDFVHKIFRKFKEMGRYYR